MKEYENMETSRALIDQVSNALKAMDTSCSELDVMTVISRPMWIDFLRELGHPEDTEPSEFWSKDAIRVYGSYTRVVESDEKFSYSKPITLK